MVALLIKFQYAFVIPIVRDRGPEAAPLRPLGGSRSRTGGRTGCACSPRWPPASASLVALIWPFGLSLWAPADPTHGLYRTLQSCRQPLQGPDHQRLQPVAQRLERPGRHHHLGLRRAQRRAGDPAAWTAPAWPSRSAPRRSAGSWSARSCSRRWRWSPLAARRAATTPEGLLLGALLLAVAFFALPTRVHERYMFPALALAAPLVLRRWPISRGWLVVAVAGAAALAFLLYVAASRPSAQDAAAAALPDRCCCWPDRRHAAACWRRGAARRSTPCCRCRSSPTCTGSTPPTGPSSRVRPSIPGVGGAAHGRATRSWRRRCFSDTGIVRGCRP